MIVTGSPSCTGLGLSLCSVILVASYRLLFGQGLSLLGDASSPLADIPRSVFLAIWNETEPLDQVVFSKASQSLLYDPPLGLIALLRSRQCVPSEALGAITEPSVEAGLQSARFRNGLIATDHPIPLNAPSAPPLATPGASDEGGNALSARLRTVAYNGAIIVDGPPPAGVRP